MFEIIILEVTIAFIAFCIGYSVAKHKYRKISSDDVIKIVEAKLNIKLMESKNKSLKKIAKLLKKAAKDRKKKAKKKSTSAIRNRFSGQNPEAHNCIRLVQKRTNKTIKKIDPFVKEEHCNTSAKS